jgi:ComF family protein
MLQTFQRAFVTPILDFIYPPLCFVCQQRLSAKEKNVCSSCWSGITPLRHDHPVWNELRDKFIAGGMVQDFLSCYLFEKEGSLQHIIHLLKYEGIKSVGIRLGKEIGKQMMNNSSFCNADYLVPVPLHTLKKRERGYNQSECICKGISEVTAISMDTSFVIRKKYTRTQTQLNIQERKKNVGDAFIVPEKSRLAIKGKTFILVDDVITTGSTINACAQELVANGAAGVLAASVALAE